MKTKLVVGLLSMWALVILFSSLFHIPILDLYTQGDLELNYNYELSDDQKAKETTITGFLPTFKEWNVFTKSVTTFFRVLSFSRSNIQNIPRILEILVSLLTWFSLWVFLLLIRGN